MDLFLDDAARRRGTTRALYEQVRDAIATGRLQAGDAVPPSRALAASLGVSRHTVTTVYGLLVAEGYLVGAAGGGTRVAATAAPAARRDRRPRADRVTVPSPVAAASAGDARAVVVDLRLGAPDPALFPVVEWRRRLARELRPATVPAAPLGAPAGEPALRAALAAWIGRSRGVSTTPAQVIVTAGAQQAFDVALTATIRPGDVVAVEDPGYHRVRELAAARGARIVGVPVDDEGLVVDALPAGARLVHVTPSHQFPLGVAMSARRRRELLTWASRHDAVVVEDDYDSELRFAGRPLEPLRLLDRDERVVYVGTFSKTLSPALRIGYLVAPAPLAARLLAAAALTNGPDAFAQRALAGFLTDGAMARQVHRARRAYTPRRDVVVAATAALRHLGRVPEAMAGLHVSLLLHPGIDVAPLVAHLERHGIAVDRLDRYSSQQAGQQGIAIGYGTADSAALRHALDRITAWRP